METKPLDHPDYRVPGTNILRFSKWSRENIPKPPHKIPLGQVVDVDIEDEWTGGSNELFIRGTARLFVVVHHFDCDGTALYGVSGIPVAMPDAMAERMTYSAFSKYEKVGLSEDALRPVMGAAAADIMAWSAFKRIMLGTTS